METPTADSSAEEQVRHGWYLLRCQRPLAARAVWQAALARDPNHRAAAEALRELDQASDLPAAARRDYRLRVPAGGASSTRWRVALAEAEGRGLSAALDAFRSLARDEPDQPAACWNLALGLAWDGRNAEAIAQLGRFVELQAVSKPDAAVDAWLLAEILRQGVGAEHLADDLSHALLFPSDAADELRRRADHLVPITLGDEIVGELPTAYEWRDRPMPTASQATSARRLPRVLATIVTRDDHVRLVSPDPASIAEARDRLGPFGDDAERVATPLPLRLLDAGLWTFRLPNGLDEESRFRLTREALEDSLENRWIHWPRHGLDGRSPASAASEAPNDPILRVKLEAVVRLREQLGERPNFQALYLGYPFDRLRLRLGLEPLDATTVDRDDLAYLGRRDLRARTPASLDDHALREAFLSADGLRAPDVAEPLANEILRRGLLPTLGEDAPLVIASLVRKHLRDSEESAATNLLVRESDDPDRRATYRRWRAQRSLERGEAEAARALYQSLDGNLGDLIGDVQALARAGYPDAAESRARAALRRTWSDEDRAVLERLIVALRTDPGSV